MVTAHATIVSCCPNSKEAHKYIKGIITFAFTNLYLFFCITTFKNASACHPQVQFIVLVSK